MIWTTDDPARTAADLDRIRSVVEAAPTSLLGQFLDPTRAGFQWPDETFVYCPRCQAAAGTRSAPRCALSADGLTWHCTGCQSTGTRYSLVDAILHRPQALRRVLAWLEDGPQ